MLQNRPPDPQPFELGADKKLRTTPDPPPEFAAIQFDAFQAASRASEFHQGIADRMQNSGKESCRAFRPKALSCQVCFAATQNSKSFPPYRERFRRPSKMNAECV